MSSDKIEKNQFLKKNLKKILNLNPTNIQNQ